MRSLTFKLTLAFLSVGLTGAVLVAVIVRQRTRTAFDQFLLNREGQTLIDKLDRYYQTHGSWGGGVPPARQGGARGVFAPVPPRRGGVPRLAGGAFPTECQPRHPAQCSG